jgi:hypothetical protein
MSATRYTCPCCGYRTLHEPPGSYDICKVCFWEDDGVQLLDPAYAGGANKLSLVECQENFRRVGACEERFVDDVRPPQAEESPDPEWRPARESDLQRPRTPRDLSPEEYKRVKTWYYWKREAT